MPESSSFHTAGRRLSRGVTRGTVALVMTLILLATLLADTPLFITKTVAKCKNPKKTFCPAGMTKVTRKQGKKLCANCKVNPNMCSAPDNVGRTTCASITGYQCCLKDGSLFVSYQDKSTIMRYDTCQLGCNEGECVKDASCLPNSGGCCDTYGDPNGRAGAKTCATIDQACNGLFCTSDAGCRSGKCSTANVCMDRSCNGKGADASCGPSASSLCCTPYYYDKKHVLQTYSQRVCRPRTSFDDGAFCKDFCISDSDCLSGSCNTGTGECLSLTWSCNNGKMDGLESCVDGGGFCPKQCLECTTSADCASTPNTHCCSNSCIPNNQKCFGVACSSHDECYGNECCRADGTWGLSDGSGGPKTCQAAACNGHFVVSNTQCQSNHCNLQPDPVTKLNMCTACATNADCCDDATPQNCWTCSKGVCT